MDKEWGSVVEAKINIVSKLKKELEKGAKGIYGMGTVTDPYQPAEREYELTRGCLVQLKRAKARVSILTKSDLVLRDSDILADWDESEVGISIGCPYDNVASVTEPGASPPSRRFAALARLSEAGITSYLMAAPILPGIGDSREAFEDLVQRAAETGVSRIIWDVFNPKPLATARLKLALSSKGFALRSPSGRSDADAVRALLAHQCTIRGIELMDAF
jgi:DNA repair photolyase